MIKSFNLYNAILYQSMAGSELSALVDANREYINSIFDIRANARLMAVLEQNPLAVDYLLTCPAIVGLVVDTPEIVDNILLHEDNYEQYLTAVSASPAAVMAISGSYMYTKIMSDTRYSSAYTPGTPATVIKALSLMLNLQSLPDTHSSFADIAEDLALIKRISVNSQALVAVGGIVGAISVIAETPAAINVFAKSQVAMDVLLGLGTSRAILIASQTAMTAIAANAYAVGVLMTKPGLQDVMNVAGAFHILAASETGMEVIAGSDTAFKVFLMNNSAALAGSEAALKKIFANTASVEVLRVNLSYIGEFLDGVDGNGAGICAESPTAIGAFCKDIEAMKVLLETPARRNKLFNSAVAVNILDALAATHNRTLYAAAAALKITVEYGGGVGTSGTIGSGKVAVCTTAYRTTGSCSGVLSSNNAIGERASLTYSGSANNSSFPYLLVGDGVNFTVTSGYPHVYFLYIPFE